MERAGWLCVLIFFGLLITGGLFSYNLPSVAIGDPTLPYLLARIGYSALVIGTGAFTLRMLREFEVQQAT